MAKPSEPAPPSGDDLRVATRAVKDAIANLSRTLTTGFAGVGVDVGREIAEELNEASRKLAASLDTQSRREARAAETRAELIAAARRVFAEKGYEAASVADLAAAAGYTKGALYAHFDSKEALFLAAVQCQQGEPSELRTSEFLASHDELGNVMLSLEAYLYALRHPEQRALLIPIAQTQLDELAAYVHLQRAGGSDEATGDDRAVAFGLAAVSVLGSILREILPEDAGITDAAARISQLLLAVLPDV